LGRVRESDTPFINKGIDTTTYGQTIGELGETFERGIIEKGPGTTDLPKGHPQSIDPAGYGKGVEPPKTIPQRILGASQEIAGDLKKFAPSVMGYGKNVYDYYSNLGLEGFFGPATPQVLESQRQSMTQPGEMGRADDLKAMQLRESIPQASAGIAGGGTYPGLLGGYTDQTSPALRFFAQTGQTGTGTQTGGSPIFSRYAQARQAVNFSLAPFSNTASQNVFTPFLQSTNLNTGIL
jgi:hypothetical protein